MSPDQIGSASVKFETSCAPPCATTSTRRSRCCIRSGSRKRPRCSRASRRRIRLRDGALGHRDEPVGQPVRRSAHRAGHRARAAHRRPRRARPGRRRRASGRSSTPSPFCSAAPTPARSAIASLSYEAAMKKIADAQSEGHRGAHFLCAGGHPVGVAHRQDLREAERRRPRFSSRCSSRCPQHPGLAHYIIHAYDAPPLAPKGARRRAPLCVARAGHSACAAHAVAHLHARRLVEGIDRDQSPIGRRRAQVAAAPPKSCTRSTIRPTRTCRSRRTRRRRRCSIARSRWRAPRLRARNRVRPRRRGGRRRVCARRDSGALRARARRLGSSGAARGQAREQHALHRSHHALRARHRRGAQRQPCGGTADIDAARRAARQAEVDAGCVLDRAGRHPAPRRAGVAAVRARTEGRRRSRKLKAAADAEDPTDKSAVSPGPLAPARELLGYMLLEAGRTKEALVAFEATMKKEPNRFRGTYGAARAAERPAIARRPKRTTSNYSRSRRTPTPIDQSSRRRERSLAVERRRRSRQRRSRFTQGEARLALRPRLLINQL